MSVFSFFFVDFPADRLNHVIVSLLILSLSLSIVTLVLAPSIVGVLSFRSDRIIHFAMRCFTVDLWTSMAFLGRYCFIEDAFFLLKNKINRIADEHWSVWSAYAPTIISGDNTSIHINAENYGLSVTAGHHYVIYIVSHPLSARCSMQNCQSDNCIGNRIELSSSQDELPEQWLFKRNRNHIDLHYIDDECPEEWHIVVFDQTQWDSSCAPSSVRLFVCQKVTKSSIFRNGPFENL